MAYRVAAADGNWTAAGTWGAVDATSLLDSQIGNTALTTSFVSSATFTPGAITIDGIAVKVASRAATPAGTMSVRLAQGGVAVAGTTVTIDVADLEQNTQSAANTAIGCTVGWVFFKFAAPVTLLAATAYTLQATTSSASQVNLFRNATGGNWSRMLRTTTTGAPGAGDSMFVLGEWTAAGTKDNRVVTYDDTSGNDYGGADLIAASLGIGKGGTLTSAVTASTAFVLRLSGVLSIWVAGILRIGTAASPIPRSSTFELQFDNAADGQFGWYSSGEFTAYGESRSAGLDSTWCLLNTDEAAGQTVLGVDRETGWLSGDDIAIASTSRTNSQHEARTLGANATATELTISVALTNAHSGTSPAQGEVILLTRNVRIRSLSTTSMGFGGCIAGTLTWGWVSSQYIGYAAGGKTAHINTLTGASPTSISLTACAFRNGEGAGLTMPSGPELPALTVTDCVFYAMTGDALDWDQTFAAAVCTITDSVAISAGISIVGAATLAWNGVRVSSAQVQIAGTAAPVLTGTIQNLIQHSHSNIGVQMSRSVRMRLLTGAIWRNNSTGLNISAECFGALFDSFTIFGNVTTNVAWEGCRQVRLNNCTIAGDTSFAVTNAINKGGVPHGELYVGNCTLSPTSGILVPCTSDYVGTSPGTFDLIIVNSTSGAATKFAASLLAAEAGARISEQRVDGVTNVHQTQYPQMGTIAVDTTTVRSSSRSQKLTPSNAMLKLRSGMKRFAIRVGETLTVGVFVQKDGSYNGNAPRLVCRANAAIGINDDLVLGTFAGASGSFIQVTGETTPAALEDGVIEVYVDCDGTAGNIFVDDWSAQVI